MAHGARAGNRRCIENGSNAEGCRSRFRAKRLWGYSSRRYPPYLNSIRESNRSLLGGLSRCSLSICCGRLVKCMEIIRATQNAEQRDSRAQIGPQSLMLHDDVLDGVKVPFNSCEIRIET